MLVIHGGVWLISLANHALSAHYVTQTALLLNVEELSGSSTGRQSFWNLERYFLSVILCVEQVSLSQ